MEIDGEIIRFLREELRSIKPALATRLAAGGAISSRTSTSTRSTWSSWWPASNKLELMIPDADLPGFTSLEALHAYLVERSPP